MNGILSVSLFCEVCSAISRSISWARCLPVVTAVVIAVVTAVVMGTKVGPSYTNLFVGFIENKFFSNYYGPKPDLYKGYIDDCVGATSSSREELNQFINSVNSFHLALKYTWEISEN